MFQESPFSGVCAYAVWEVILMLVGTLLLGLLLGYLIWGWTRRKLMEAEAQIATITATNESLKNQLAALASTNSEQQQELDLLNTMSSSQRQQLASLTVANSNLKRQLDEVVAAGEESKSGLASLQSDVASLEAQIGDLQSQLNDANSRNSELKSTLKKMRKGKARAAESVKPSTVDSDPANAPVTSVSGSISDPFSTASQEVERQAHETTLLAQASEIFGKEIMDNDLVVIEGIGPKIAEVLRNSGITTWDKLSGTTRQILRVILDEAGPKFHGHKPKTWPRQARMAANGEWKKLKAYQEVLLGGK